MSQDQLHVPFLPTDPNTRRNFEVLRAALEERLAAVSGSAASQSLVQAPEWWITDSPTDEDTDDIIEVYGFRFQLNPTGYASIVVSYNPGGGAEQYTYNTSGTELHELRLTNGTDRFLAENTQASFDITITPYPETGGGGTPGQAVTIPTGTPLKSGRGMVVRTQLGTLLSGSRLIPGYPFDFDVFPGLNDEPGLILRVPFSAGSQGGTWNPNYANSPTQVVTSLSSALTIGQISNFPTGATMNIHIVRGSYSITLSSTYFQGALLTWSDGAYAAISIVNFGLAKLVAGVMRYS